jgi:hypothetical protein
VLHFVLYIEKDELENVLRIVTTGTSTLQISEELAVKLLEFLKLSNPDYLSNNSTKLMVELDTWLSRKPDEKNSHEIIEDGFEEELKRA